jgi:hypothetical protein
MFTKHKIYYTIEVREEDSFQFVCSFSTYSEAEAKVEELRQQTEKEYRILKVEKDVEEVY